MTLSCIPLTAWLWLLWLTLARMSSFFRCVLGLYHQHYCKNCGQDRASVLAWLLIWINILVFRMLRSVCEHEVLYPTSSTVVSLSFRCHFYGSHKSTECGFLVLNPIVTLPIDCSSSHPCLSQSQHSQLQLVHCPAAKLLVGINQMEQITPVV